MVEAYPIAIYNYVAAKVSTANVTLERHEYMREGREIKEGESE